MVHQHLDGTFTITYGPHRVGHYDAQGQVIPPASITSKGAAGKSQSNKEAGPKRPGIVRVPIQGLNSGSFTQEMGSGAKAKPSTDRNDSPTLRGLRVKPISSEPAPSLRPGYPLGTTP